MELEKDKIRMIISVIIVFINIVEFIELILIFNLAKIIIELIHKDRIISTTLIKSRDVQVLSYW